MKRFYRESIPESSYVRKDTVDIDILIISGNGVRNIVQPIE